MKNNVVVDSGEQQDTKQNDTNTSLNKTAQLGKPEHGELVPSRYALRGGPPSF